MLIEYKLNNCLTFKNVNLNNLKKGLIVFSGPSGSGKSVLMKSILGNFSLEEPIAKSSESVFDLDLDLVEYGIEKDDFIFFKQIKENKNRFFINNNSISKKSIKEISSKFIKHLSLKDYSDFENSNLINLIDSIISKKDKTFYKKLENFKNIFKEFNQIKEERNKIYEEEKKIENLKEFTEFEIEKIEKINPKSGEFEKLQDIKNKMSKKDKIEQSIQAIEPIFELEDNIYKFLDIIEKDKTEIEIVFNEIRNYIEEFGENFEYSDIEIENMLDKISGLNELNNKHGSIENALIFLEKKKKELEYYNNISFEKHNIDKKFIEIENKINQSSKEISKLRNSFLNLITNKLTEQTNLLYLENIKIFLENIELSKDGIDKVRITLNNTDFSKMSTGEFNRLRLAILALKTLEISNMEEGILMLDEIDANLSGEESMSVAKVLKTLSKKYQIFAISHQPQLTSCADIHILVEKENNISSARILEKEERINEIARLISGDNIRKEAFIFAKNLINEQN